MPTDTQIATTSPQLSLVLFEEMFASETSIAEATREIGFRRNNLFVDISGVGLAARRAIDAAFLIVAQAAQVLPRYDVDLSYFRWLMSYDSRNYRHLRTVLREAQKASVQITEIADNQLETANDRWISVPMLGAVGIADGRVVFEVHEVLQKHIKSPTNSHFLSLRITASFTLLFARAIYDHVMLLAEQEWSAWLPLATVQNWGTQSDSRLEFKYFRRDVLDPAVLQINELADIQLSYEKKTIAGSRRIGSLRFKVTRKAGQTLVEQSALYLVLKDEFGLSTKNFDEIFVNREVWSDERIKQAIEFTRAKILDGKVSRSASGFLMQAIRENWKIATADRLIAEQQAKATQAQVEQKTKVADSELEHQTKRKTTAAKVTSVVKTESIQGLALYVKFPEATQRAYLTEFAGTPQAALTANRTKVNCADLTVTSILGHPAIAQVFGQFLFKKLKSSDTSTKAS